MLRNTFCVLFYFVEKCVQVVKGFVPVDRYGNPIQPVDKFGNAAKTLPRAPDISIEGMPDTKREPLTAYTCCNTT